MGKAMKTEKGRRAIGAVKITVIVVCLATVIISATFFAVRSILKAEFPMKYQDKISLYAETYGVPEDLLYGVIHTESGYDEKAKSHAGAIGLTQITPETFLWLQTKTGENLPEEALYDADTSVKYCAVFYGLLLKEFGGDEKTAIAAYHAGRGQVNAWLRDPAISPDGKTLVNIPESETKKYVEKVQRAVSIYDKLYKKELNKI